MPSERPDAESGVGIEHDDPEMVRCRCLNDEKCGNTFHAWPSIVDRCPYCAYSAEIIERAVPQEGRSE